MKKTIQILLFLTLQTTLSAQLQKGDWLINSKFYWANAGSKIDKTEKKNITSSVSSWEFSAGLFLTDKFFFGLNAHLERETNERITLLDTEINREYFLEEGIQFSPIFRYYWHYQSKRSLFFQSQATLGHRRMEYARTRFNDKFRDWLRIMGDIGIGLSFNKLKELNFELLLQYQFYNNNYKKPVWVIKNTPGRFSFSINWYAHITKLTLNNANRYFPNNFEKGTKMIQFNLNLLTDFGDDNALFVDFGAAYFPLKKWAIGVSLPIQISGGSNFDLGLFTRYYYFISPQIQVFPHLEVISQHRDRFYGYARWTRNSFEETIAFFYGMGLNFMLNQNVGLDLVYGKLDRNKGEHSLPFQGFLVKSKINYFF